MTATETVRGGRVGTQRLQMSAIADLKVFYVRDKDHIHHIAPRYFLAVATKNCESIELADHASFELAP